MDNQTPGPSQRSPIISLPELRKLLDADEAASTGTSTELVLADCRAYLDDREGIDAYNAGHIPGARFVDLERVLSASPSRTLGRHPLPDPEVFATGLSEAGIGHDTTVVAYDDAGGMIAGRLVWMLRTLGQDAAILDGGIDAWDGELETEHYRRSPVGHAPRPWPLDAMVDADGVAATIDAGGLVIDSRGAARYRGEIEPIDPIAGHIPGATNAPFADNLDDGYFRSPEELRERFAGLGVNEKTVYYCGSGVSACHNMLAAEASGFGRGLLYVGSWSGWSGSGRPHEVGD